MRIDDFITLTYDPLTQDADLSFDDNGFIARGNALETLCIVSLFSDARAEGEDLVTYPRGFRRGWWGDSYRLVDGESQDTDRFGSHIWTLFRRKISLETVRRTRSFCERALSWMPTDSICATVAVTAQRLNDDVVLAGISITRPNEPTWQHLWRVV